MTLQSPVTNCAEGTLTSSPTIDPTKLVPGESCCPTSEVDIDHTINPVYFLHYQIHNMFMEVKVTVESARLSQDNRIKQRRAWQLLGWVTAERSCPCKQPACPAIRKSLKSRWSPGCVREGFLALNSPEGYKAALGCCCVGNYLREWARGDCGSSVLYNNQAPHSLARPTIDALILVKLPPHISL
ncbi:hypothetical protein J6590_049327 [Homalodisca vitripennis]|nr:hypothetical protein J6590_049327 [Homalodisca vitripennis]